MLSTLQHDILSDRLFNFDMKRARQTGLPNVYAPKNSHSVCCECLTKTVRFSQPLYEKSLPHYLTYVIVSPYGLGRAQRLLLPAYRPRNEL
jgi:hypothetical protein